MSRSKGGYKLRQVGVYLSSDDFQLFDLIYSASVVMFSRYTS